MSKPYLNLLHRDAATQEQAGTCMTEVVESNFFQIVLFDEPCEMLCDIVGAKDLSGLVHADVIEVVSTIACYAQLNIDSSKLERYVGKQYLAEDTRTWYYPTELGNLKYLIQKDSSGALTLWSFNSFCMEEGETHTYGDILSIIYGVDSPDAIVSITTSPSKANNTDTGIAIQKKVGTQTYTSREDIEAFFSVVWDVVCYGTDSESKADNNRFTYSFSTDDSDKLTSGESTYGTRCIKVEFADGSILDSWRYSALSGSFYEYGGVFTDPLSDEDVFVTRSRSWRPATRSSRRQMR